MSFRFTQTVSHDTKLCIKTTFVLVSFSCSVNISEDHLLNVSLYTAFDEYFLCFFYRGGIIKCSFSSVHQYFPFVGSQICKMHMPYKCDLMVVNSQFGLHVGLNWQVILE